MTTAAIACETPAGHWLERVRASLRAVEELAEHPPPLETAADLAAFERECTRGCDAVHAIVMGTVTQLALDRAAVKAKAQELAAATSKRLKPADVRTVYVQFQRGPRVPLSTQYYRRRKRDVLRREKGLFPAFVLLGIQERASPGATSQIARAACAMSSLEEAAACLRDTGGLDVDVKTIRRITRRFGQCARSALPDHLRIMTPNGEGRTLVISVDGGRLRVRRDKRGPPTRKGRRRYHTDWREPLLLHVYVLNPDGSVDRSFSPLIDGTLGGADTLFDMLRLYLPSLLSIQPTRVVLIADGAPWIWARFEAIVKDGCLAGVGQVLQLIDFYHAVQHLGVFAQEYPGWHSACRTRWRNKARSLLRKGKIGKVLADMQRLVRRHPRNKALKREMHYFLNNGGRFCYAWARRLRVPIGSGPMESAVRRVINMRLKGPGIFWHEDTAETMIMIRAYYKAQRWHEIERLGYSAPVEALL
ncbi:MAG TPA: hypothetical protein PKX48_06670 [Planctomycetota bacterium]|nr:hypothetical protein [Planctomycetota bacterium]HNR99186.1 hypothetical protein [Planctomycetota bacterium]HNU25259.1 hypothetical protein [Planctomycetota bacterium]HOE86836.1 hypothetical protein [Planctomycetota bacterium]HPL60333.1 hypothetical protein [Planctomycetota bacterium]